METIVKLISAEYTENELKQQVSNEKVRNVFGSVRSVGANEFFKAGHTGLKPKLVVEIRSFEYDGEMLVEVHGKRYTVYRNYVNRNENIELYLEERSGAR